ncbi:MAG: LysR family transcriptional regulator [Sphingobium sp.]|nr:LysR family transcriptional regulator [Sphingobium sp.]MBP6110840.1 LysR family transcriptional regulator [Sphingobium sp.]MBP8670016.1 LysR family transcriptional regulator [Sphingobium sp.]MBP9157119.1 LysR family transcriptional regulator [Sphingobium sp.]
MNWNELRIFLSVARHGNLIAAGRALKMDPTTVSRRVSSLEAVLQQALFERTHEGFVLTSHGRALLSHAQEMESIASRIELASASRKTLSGQLRVSVSEGFGAYFIAPHLAEFSAAHPQLDIDLVASNGFLNPSKREADLAILLTRPRRGLLKVRKLTGYGLGLYAPSARGDWLAALVEGSLRESDIPFVGYVPDFIYAPELRYLDEIESGLEASVRSTSIIAQQELIAGGAGIGVLPHFMASREPALTHIRPDISIRRDFWLAIHRDVAGQPRVQAFIEWLGEIVMREAGLVAANGLPSPQEGPGQLGSKRDEH